MPTLVGAVVRDKKHEEDGEAERPTMRGSREEDGARLRLHGKATLRGPGRENQRGDELDTDGRRGAGREASGDPGRAWGLGAGRPSLEENPIQEKAGRLGASGGALKSGEQVASVTWVRKRPRGSLSLPGPYIYSARKS